MTGATAKCGGQQPGNLPGREWTSATKRIGDETREAFRKLDGDECADRKLLQRTWERKTERPAKFVGPAGFRDNKVVIR